MISSRLQRLWLRAIALSLPLSLVLNLALNLAPNQGSTVQAQQVPDQSLGKERSRVQPHLDSQGRQGIRIQGGAIRGENLFHSFRRFDVRSGQRVIFANPSGIANILMRVTGGSRSEIDGTIGVAGTANLFVLNPNGILFGENAQLDVNGAFIATSAAAVNFAGQGRFTADPAGLPLLTVAPSALLFNAQPQPIMTQQARLEGGAIALFGGEVQVNGGSLQSRGAIALGGLNQTGQISITSRDHRFQFGFPEPAIASDVKIDGRRSRLGTAFIEGDRLAIHANQIRLDRANVRVSANSPGSSGAIQLVGQGIALYQSNLSSVALDGLTTSDDILLQANGDILLRETSIDSSTRGADSGGSLIVRAHSLRLDRSALLAVTTATGNAGNIFVYTEADTTLSRGSFFSAATDSNPTQRIGDGGQVILIFGGQLRLQDGSYITAVSRDEGNSGTLLLTDTNPARSTTERSPAILDGQVSDRACSLSAAANQLIITGRGGLPPVPGQSPPSEAAIVEWVTGPRQSRALPDNAGQPKPLASGTSPPAEAQGWVTDGSGRIRLIAQVSAVQSPGFISPPCGAS